MILPQDRSKVTKAPKLSKEDGRIDWTRSNLEIHNLVRAMQPWPVASTTWHRPTGPVRLIVHQTKPVEGQGAPGQVLEAEGDRLVVAAGSGAVRLLRVQLEGKKPCPVEDFLRGHQPLGAFLGGIPNPLDPLSPDPYPSARRFHFSALMAPRLERRRSMRRAAPVSWVIVACLVSAARPCGRTAIRIPGITDANPNAVDPRIPRHGDPGGPDDGRRDGATTRSSSTS